MQIVIFWGTADLVLNLWSPKIDMSRIIMNKLHYYTPYLRSNQRSKQVDETGLNTNFINSTHNLRSKLISIRI